MSMKPSIAEAIKAINPIAEFLIDWQKNDTVETCSLVWSEGTAEISRADIQTKLTELETEYDAQDYARKREAEYPPLKEFAEAYTEKEFGGDSTKMDAYKIKYEKVRSDNPK